jgi:hypothetical protein
VLYQGLSNFQKKIKIPLPQEATRQAEKLNPEEITQIEVDEQIRDRLRTDPEWREIAAVIHQDIMILKWSAGKPQNPAWKRYGAKSQPNQKCDRLLPQSPSKNPGTLTSGTFGASQSG